MKIKHIIFSLFLACSSGYAQNQPASTFHNSASTWLTFDACGGLFDWKIANFLVDNKIKPSIFVTSVWMHKNPAAIVFLKQHPDIFKIENHGHLHHAAVLSPTPVHHVKTVLDEAGLDNEVFTAQKEIEKIFGQSPHWFRGAPALYDTNSMNWFKLHDIHLAGYSLAVDFGATANAHQIYQNFKKAKKGDILLMYINKPSSQNYKGLVMSLELIKILKPDWNPNEF